MRTLLLFLLFPLFAHAQGLLYCPGTIDPNRHDAASTYAGSSATGPVFDCQNASSAGCVSFGPGACTMAGVNGSGFIQFGIGCSPVLDVGDSTRIQSGQATFTNGGVFLNGTTYLQNASGAVAVNDVDGLAINSTTPLKGLLITSVTVDIGSIDANACADVTATVAGVNANDAVYVTPNAALGVGDVVVGNARVTNAATDEVTFRACNASSGPENPNSAAFLFLVMRP